jgi:hypothetical protein
VDNKYLMKLTCKQVNRNKLNQILLKKDVLKKTLQKRSNKVYIYVSLFVKKSKKQDVFNYLLLQDKIDSHVKQIEYNIYITKKITVFIVNFRR